MSEKELSREEKLIDAIRTIITMTSEDIFKVVIKLMTENVKLQNECDDLRHDLQRLKEDNELNEAAYEQYIKELKERK